MSLLAPKFLVLYLFLASALYVHLRGRVRFRFTRQLFNHSTLLAPYNALMYLFSAVPAKPVIDPAGFPELAPLAANWTTIRDEARRLFDEGYIRGALANNDVGFNSFFKRGWKRFYLKWYGDPLPSAATHSCRLLALAAIARRGDRTSPSLLSTPAWKTIRRSERARSRTWTW